MLSKNQKRFILIFIDLLFSAFIWNVNASWGNTFLTCLMLSITTFLIIFTPFEIYWSFRDIWFDRWIPLYLKELEISKIKIAVEGGLLHGDLVKNKSLDVVDSKNAIIIICHGFSDTKETLQYYYYPLAIQGYIILAYDARGTGASKKTGKRNDFLKRIDDYRKVIEWIKSNDALNKLKLFSVGFSIGAITALCGGFPDKNIEKIVAISTISNYKENLTEASSLLKFTYSIKGVNISPKNDINQKLSPYLVMESIKNNLSKKEWKIFSQKVLLIHAKNDKVIKFKNFQQNKLLLETSDRNLILKKGGHSQKKNELALVGASIRFFNRD